MSTLTEAGTIQEVVDGTVTGTEARLGGAGYIKRLMWDVIGNFTQRTDARLGARGRLIASVPVKRLDPKQRIVTPVDATVTIAANTTGLSTDAIVVDSVAAGDGIVQVNGAWLIYTVATPTLSTPIDEETTVDWADLAVSTGAIVIDSEAAGNGIVNIKGLWTLS